MPFAKSPDAFLRMPMRARTLLRCKNDELGGKTHNLEKLVEAHANAHESPRSVDDNDVGVISN